MLVWCLTLSCNHYERVIWAWHKLCLILYKRQHFRTDTQIIKAKLLYWHWKIVRWKIIYLTCRERHKWSSKISTQLSSSEITAWNLPSNGILRSTHNVVSSQLAWYSLSGGELHQNCVALNPVKAWIFFQTFISQLLKGEVSRGFCCFRSILC